MKYIKSKLSHQLLSTIIIAFSIILISVGIILPNTMLPIYEKNLYNYLKQPLDFLDEDIIDNSISSEIGYIYVYNDVLSYSDNFNELVKNGKVSDFLSLIKGTYGNFYYRGQKYYYYTTMNDSIQRVAFTNNSYIIRCKKDSWSHIFPIIFLTLIIVSFILISWSSVVVKKIEKLKNKIDHIDDDTYNHIIEDSADDEIRSLELAIEDMRISLKNQEEYRNQMYQNISHDFKTPLTVIESYIEAVEDGVEDSNNALKIIKEQTIKLENKVHSLLYLNKLDYFKDLKALELKEVDIEEIINTSVEKFKYRNTNINFVVQFSNHTKFLGTVDSWETIIDNLLNNAVRYAEKEIKITVKKNQITVYNDGPNIDNDLIKGIFVPFRKGVKGEFGLGLSIVKKTLTMMKCDIVIKNHNKKGVSFVIYKK